MHCGSRAPFEVVAVSSSTERRAKTTAVATPATAQNGTSGALGRSNHRSRRTSHSDVRDTPNTFRSGEARFSGFV